MDMNWCIICDKHVDLDDSLYCSETCQQEDAKSVGISHGAPQLTYETRKHTKISSKLTLVNVTTYPSPPMTPVLSPIRISKTSPQPTPTFGQPKSGFPHLNLQEQSWYRSPTSPDSDVLFNLRIA
ncbi:hypothetical protein K7432_012470 [Basidiobolus ranarum]|uniref:Uncharacterized protein n=1 Tax=Basidiobolus ranarum TaxID=34480 RepID=A0ABR2WKQ5_9FUNG